MKKILLSFVFFLLSVSPILARSGCCSSHGGVCGCGCCDGTDLSAKCAPYYPSCGQASGSDNPSGLSDKQEQEILDRLNSPEGDDLIKKFLESRDTPTPPHNSNNVIDKNDENSDPLLSLLIVGGLGYGGYKLLKKK